MKLKHYPAGKLKKEILTILGKHLDLSRRKVFFFGSRVSGGADDRSDIDVGILGPPISAGAWLDIQEEFENLPTLYKVEIVDLRRTDDVFRDVALEHTETISSPA